MLIQANIFYDNTDNKLSVRIMDFLYYRKVDFILRLNLVPFGQVNCPYKIRGVRGQ